MRLSGGEFRSVYDVAAGKGRPADRIHKSLAVNFFLQSNCFPLVSVDFLRLTLVTDREGNAEIAVLPGFEQRPKE